MRPVAENKQTLKCNQTKLCSMACVHCCCDMRAHYCFTHLPPSLFLSRLLKVSQSFISCSFRYLVNSLKSKQPSLFWSPDDTISCRMETSKVKSGRRAHHTPALVLLILFKKKNNPSKKRKQPKQNSCLFLFYPQVNKVRYFNRHQLLNRD